MSLPKRPCQTAVGAHQAVRKQPAAGILGILLEPGAAGPEPKAVAPGVHVREQTITPDADELIGEQHLQVAHGVLFALVTTGVGVQAGTAVRVHTDIVRGLVQHRMDRRIGAHEQPVTNQSGLGRTPVGAGYRRLGRHQDRTQAEVIPQQRVDMPMVFAIVLQWLDPRPDGDR